MFEFTWDGSKEKKKEEEKKWTTSMGILTGKLMEIDSETLTCHIVYLQKI